jgi:hypothetical protein
MLRTIGGLLLLTLSLASVAEAQATDGDYLYEALLAEDPKQCSYGIELAGCIHGPKIPVGHLAIKHPERPAYGLAER